MAEDLIREIHTQLDLITSGLAALARGSHCVVSQNHLRPAAAFSQEINGTTYTVRAFFDDEAKENIVEKVQPGLF